MATWQQWEQAVAAGHIKYMYMIKFQGQITTTKVPYCTGREDMVFRGDDYYAYPIIHEDIKYDEVDAETTVRIPAARLWIETCLKHSPKVTLELFRWRDELSDAQSLFYGDMINTQFSDNIVQLKFGTPIGASNSQLITYYTQRYCNHDMYGKYCGLNFDTFKQTFETTEYEVGGRSHFDIGTELDWDYWINGLIFYIIRIDDEQRHFYIEQSNMMRAVEGTNIVTKYPISSYIDTDYPLIIAPNCMLSLARCRDYFGNMSRACAWPDMPRANYAVIDTTRFGKGNQGNIGNKR